MADNTELEVETTLEQEPEDDTNPAEVVPGEGESEEDDEGVDVQIGDEAPPASEVEQQAAPGWAKELRKKNREDQKRIRELAEENARLKSGTPDNAAQTPTEPTLEACDYDEDVYKAKLATYLSHKQKAEAKAEELKKQKDDEAAEAETRRASYKQSAVALGVKDYDDAEAEVADALSQDQQGILIAGCGDNAPKIVYALSKHPAELAKLAAIKNPIQFAFAVAKLEDKVKVTPRSKTPPAPETRLTGTASLSTGKGDKTLDRLEADAARTGDRSKVIAYKRSLKAK